MAWRPLAERQTASNQDRKKAMKQTINAGMPIGILAYQDGQPMAWCSIAPRLSYRPLDGDEYPGIKEDEVWSLVCFFVPRKLRGLGIMKHLLQQALRTARKRGAQVVEAYPVDPDSPSYRFMGFISAFKKAGFVETKLAGKRRHVMHKRIP